MQSNWTKLESIEFLRHPMRLRSSVYGVDRWTLIAFLAIVSAVIPSAMIMAQTSVMMEIKDIHGQVSTGNLISLDEENLVYKLTGSTEAQSMTKTDEILRIDRIEKNSKRISTTAFYSAGLVDGSELNLQRIEGKEKNWTLQLDDRLAQNGFSGELKYLKLKQLDAAGQEAWESFLGEDNKSDALIVVRPGGALDRVDGLVKEIRDSKVLFDVDGQDIEASLDRLAGVLWYRKEQPTAAKGFQVRLANGSRLFTRKILVSEGTVQLVGSSGDSLEIPLDWLESIDCGLNKMAWVWELATLDVRANERIGFGELDSVFASAFKPRWIEGAGGNQNLLFSGPGEYVFRAPEGMTQLQTRLQRANESEIQSPVMLEVWVDDQVAFKKELSAEQLSIDVEVSIASEKKIKFVVGNQSALNLGTRVVMIEPRVSK